MSFDDRVLLALEHLQVVSGPPVSLVDLIAVSRLWSMGVRDRERMRAALLQEVGRLTR